MDLSRADIITITKSVTTKGGRPEIVEAYRASSTRSYCRESMAIMRGVCFGDAAVRCSNGATQVMIL